MMAPRHATSPVPSCPLSNEPAQLYCIVPRDDHGHHDHESYYGDCDTDSLVKVRTRLGLDMEQKKARKEENLRIMMEDLIPPIKLESQMNTLDNSSTKLANGLKKTAPVTEGCLIEGFVHVNKFPGNLVILARSVAHIFDVSQMNMSHIISIFSFGLTLDTTSVTRINPHEITHFFEVHMNGMSGKEHKSSKETPFLMASVHGIESSVECNASTRYNPKGKISLIRVRRQKNRRSIPFFQELNPHINIHPTRLFQVPPGLIQVFFDPLSFVVALDAAVLSMEGDIDVLGPSILNPKRIGVDDVKGTGEKLLYRLLWGEESWNWWGGGA
ncbi:Protein disulfide-isomerase 5-3 [Capsicum baccatum]|uniref:Protein disulfide-isomerase 5-3 n=1 Tax=Capsicum baccatum TaxID=33114 RepID=A0A2G2VSE1_CAPBA|nr:Protein disulfide-isomerase 5-3 [Capsicum baccatum]